MSTSIKTGAVIVLKKTYLLKTTSEIRNSSALKNNVAQGRMLKR